MQIGRKIYFDKLTGNILADTGERHGFVRETSTEEDFQTYQALAERVPETVGVLHLGYGQYAQDFAECDGYRINPETEKVEFSYPDPNQEEPQEPVYQKPLSEHISELEDSTANYMLDLDYRLSMIELGI